jgi:hypothetical protein
MTYFEAAVAVMRGARKPLTVSEIVALALERGYLAPKGETPVATMTAELYRRVRSDSRLVKLELPGIKRAQRGSVRWSYRKT